MTLGPPRPHVAHARTSEERWGVMVGLIPCFLRDQGADETASMWLHRVALADHSVAQLLAFAFKVTPNSDDPAYFGECVGADDEPPVADVG